MRFGAAGNNAQAAFDEGLRHHIGVFQDLNLIILEAGLQCFLERNRLARDHMHQRPTLNAGKDRRVDDLFVLGLHQDDAATWPAQRFVRGRGHHIGMWHRIGVHARCNQTRVMRHIDHEIRADFLGDFGEALEIDA